MKHAEFAIKLCNLFRRVPLLPAVAYVYIISVDTVYYTMCNSIGAKNESSRHKG